MGHYICSTRENARYWFNWSCCGVTMLIFIQSIFVASNLITIVCISHSIVLIISLSQFQLVYIHYGRKSFAFVLLKFYVFYHNGHIFDVSLQILEVFQVMLNHYQLQQMKIKKRSVRNVDHTNLQELIIVENVIVVL